MSQIFSYAWYLNKKKYWSDLKHRIIEPWGKFDRFIIIINIIWSIKVELGDVILVALIIRFKKRLLLIESWNFKGHRGSRTTALYGTTIERGIVILLSMGNTVPDNVVRQLRQLLCAPLQPGRCCSIPRQSNNGYNYFFFIVECRDSKFYLCRNQTQL